MEYFDPPSYEKLIRNWGYDVLVQVDENEYQGDTWVLLQDGSRYGYLVFGWGSCSGCDALQACETEKDVAELSSELQGKITWQPSKEAMRQFLESHDWKGDYGHWYAPNKQQEFKEKAFACLEGD